MSKAFGIYCVGLFANNFLPSGFGGDGIRVVLLRQYTSVPNAIFFIMLDRVMGLLSLLILGFIMVINRAPEDLIWHITRNQVLDIGILVLIIGLFILLLLKYNRFRIFLRSQLSILSLVGQSQRYFERWPVLLTLTLVISLVSQLVLAGALYAGFISINIQVSFTAAILQLVVASIALFLPITINGIGLQENIFVAVLGLYGIAASHALVFALLIRFLMLILSSLCGLISLTFRPN